MIKKIFKGISFVVEGVASIVAPHKESNFFFISLLFALVITLFGFLPIFGVNGLFIKNLILPIISGVLLIIFALQSLKNGSFIIHDKKVFWGVTGFLGIMFISSLFSVSPKNALFGTLGESPSFAILFSLAIIFFIASISIKRFSHVLGLLIVIATTYLFVFLHVVSRIFMGTNFLSFGFLNTFTSTIIGSWTDFGVFSLLIFVSALICLEMGKFVRLAKWITLFLGGIALIGLFLVNMRWIWFFAGIFSLITSIYVFSVAYWDSEKSSYSRFRSVPWYSLISFLIVLVGILFGGMLLEMTGKSAQFTYQEVYPSFSATAQSGIVGLKEKSITGVGLGSFDYLWNQIKPIQLSGSSFESLEFSNGYSFITTILATTGILGIVATAGVILLVGYRYYQVYQSGFNQISERFTAIIVLTGSIVLTFIVLVNYPGVSILILWAIFMGALWGIFPTKEERSFSFINDPRASFFGMVIVLLLIFIGGSFIYINSRKTASVVHYGNSLRFSTQNNQASMIASFTRANQLWKTDFYNRILANQILTQMSSIQLDKTTQQGVLSQEVQKVLSAALSYADTATKLDTKNYRNWITLGDVYKFFVYLKMEGAAEKAQEAYTQARLLSPNNTTIDISIADLELLLGNTSSANKIITDSITKFPTVNAYFWLYQQNQKANQIDEAESNLLKAVQLQPNNVQLINFFGKFMFNYKKYDKAISLFERSLTLNKLQPDIFAFLGVSYESLGKTEEAKQIFEFLKRELPDTAQKMIDQIHVQQGITPAVETFNIQDDSNNSQIIEESALSTQ